MLPNSLDAKRPNICACPRKPLLKGTTHGTLIDMKQTNLKRLAILPLGLLVIGFASTTSSKNETCSTGRALAFATAFVVPTCDGQPSSPIAPVVLTQVQNDRLATLEQIAPSLDTEDSAELELGELSDEEIGHLASLLTH
jgi:hypothetical protein